MDFAHERRQVALTDLRPHPRQASVFNDVSDSELAELATNIKDYGLQHPIHILADGTIVSGHQRVRAARLLGWDTITAVVRDDLGEADSLTSVEHLIQENLQRRHLDPLGIARCYQELKRLAQANGRIRGTGNVRDQISSRLPGQYKGRTLDRLVRLLELPDDVQEMFRDHRLNQSQAEKILRLPQEGRDAAYEALRGGQPARQVVKDLGGEKAPREVTTLELAQSLAVFINEHIEELSQHPDDLSEVVVKGADLAYVLDRAAEFFSAWRDRERASSRKVLEDLQAKLPVHPRLARAWGMETE